MAGQQTYDPEETRSIAERLLSERFGGPVRLGEDAALKERTHVTRFAGLDGPGGAPAGAIVKRARVWEGQVYDPDATDPHTPSAHLFGDWAALQFLSQVAGKASIAP